MALLQKAAPHSTLTGLGTNGQLGGSVGPLSGAGGAGGLVDDGVGVLGGGAGVGSLGNGTGIGGLGTGGGIGSLGNGGVVGTLPGIGGGNGVGGLGTGALGGGGSGGVGSSAQHGSILSSLSNNMGEALKSGGLVNSVGGSGSNVPSSVQPPYTSPNAPLQNSIFSNPGKHCFISTSFLFSCFIFD